MVPPQYWQRACSGAPGGTQTVAPHATHTFWTVLREVLLPILRSPWPWGWFPWPPEVMAPDRCAFPRHGVVCSGSNPPTVGYRHATVGRLNVAGPLTRCAVDAALYLDAIAGTDFADDLSPPTKTPRADDSVASTAFGGVGGADRPKGGPTRHRHGGALGSCWCLEGTWPCTRQRHQGCGGRGLCLQRRPPG